MPRWVRLLLAAGEHRLVDYKGSNIPNDIAKTVAGGANTLARLNVDESFVVFLGVEEVRHPNGHRSGRPVGLRDGRTQLPADLDAVEQQVMNTVRNNVTPIPEIDVDRVGIGTAHPFIALRVLPKDPPHRVDDRYCFRAGSHSFPLEAGDLRAMFVRARTEAFISELNLDNPVSRGIAHVAALTSAVAAQIADLDIEFKVGVSSVEDAVSDLGKRIDDVDGVASLQDAFAELADHLAREFGLAHPDTVWGALQEIRSRTEPLTMEETYLALVEQRREHWMTLTRGSATQHLDDRTNAAAVRLYESRFTSDPDVLSFARNRAELGGWQMLHRGRLKTLVGDRYRDAVFRLCCAATGQAMGSGFDKEWLALDACLERTDLLTLQHELDSSPSREFPHGDVEAAIIDVDTEALREAVLTSDARFTRTDAELIGWRLRNHEVRFATAADGPTAVVVLPAFGSPDRPDSVEAVRRLRRRLRPRGLDVVRSYPTTGGLLARLAGERSASEQPGGAQLGRSVR